MAIDEKASPQLARMQAVQAESQTIGQFLDWLSENGMAICKPQDGLRGERYFPIAESTEQLLARHFEVDLNAVERERRALLADLAAKDAARPAALTVQALEARLAERFPVNATDWSQAGDEVRDMCRGARELAKLGEDQAVDFQALTTPSAWNTEGIKGILRLYGMLSPEGQRDFCENFASFLRV